MYQNLKPQINVSIAVCQNLKSQINISMKLPFGGGWWWYWTGEIRNCWNKMFNITTFEF